jgi:hypothetical protein
MPEIEILDVVEIFSPQPGRIGKKDVMVTYTVGGVRRYVVTLPAEDASEAKIVEHIKKVEAERQKVVGKKFTI